MFYNEHVVEEVLNPYLANPDMKSFYPIQVIDLNFQIIEITLKKIQLFEEFIADPIIVKLFEEIFKHRQLKLISDDHKITQVKVIENGST